MTRVDELDWDDLRLVGFIAATGTLAAAARRLGVDQTTAARRLARLERRLGFPLFDRHDRRLLPRPAVAAVESDLATMTTTARRITGRLRDERFRLQGAVLVSTVDLLATRLLAPALATFRADHPGVRLEIVTEDRNVSIGEREADIALRLARPAADTALTRRLGGLAFAFYGPVAARDRDTAPLAGYGERHARLPESRWLAAQYPDQPVVFRTDQVAALIEAVAAGHRAVLPCRLGDADPRLVRLGDGAPILVREVWSMVHPDRRGDEAVAATLAWIETTWREAAAAEEHRSAGRR